MTGLTRARLDEVRDHFEVEELHGEVPVQPPGNSRVPPAPVGTPGPNASSIEAIGLLASLFGARSTPLPVAVALLSSRAPHCRAFRNLLLVLTGRHWRTARRRRQSLAQRPRLAKTAKTESSKDSKHAGCNEKPRSTRIQRRATLDALERDVVEDTHGKPWLPLDNGQTSSSLP